MTRAGELAFWVAGTPIPQGSHNAPRAGVVIDQQNIKTKRRKRGGLDAWRRSVSILCRKAAMASGWHRLSGPVELVLEFELARPRSVTRLWPTVKPDLSKLWRAVEDAMTGVAYDDDAQVVSAVGRKIYAAEGAEPGVMITVKEIDP